jgi:hypothetical protein
LEGTKLALTNPLRSKKDKFIVDKRLSEKRLMELYYIYWPLMKLENKNSMEQDHKKIKQMKNLS